MCGTTLAHKNNSQKSYSENNSVCADYGKEVKEIDWE
jgi:hypothetical protein